MKVKCPNKNTEAWKNLEAIYGQVGALFLYDRNNEEIPSLERAKELLSNKAINHAESPNMAKKRILKTSLAQDGFISPQAFVTATNEINKYNTNYGSKVLTLKQATSGSYYIQMNRQFFSMDTPLSTRETDEELDRLLIQTMTSMGVKVEFLDSLKERTGVDATGAYMITEKLILIAKGLATEDVLPEEVAHAVIAGLGGSGNPMVAKLMSDVVATDIYRQVKIDYRDLYETEEEFREESVGKILAMYILSTHKGEEINTIVPNKNLADKMIYSLKLLWERVKQLFGKGNIELLRMDVREIYGELASKVLKDDLNGLQAAETGDTLYHTTISSLATINENKIAALKARIAKYASIAKTSKNEETENYVDELRSFVTSIEDLEDEVKFIEIIKQADKDLSKIKTRIANKGYTDFTSLGRALDIVEAYSNLDIFAEDSTNAVIKKSAVALENARKEIELNLRANFEDLLTNEMSKESLNPNIDLEEILIARKDISTDQRYLGAISNSDDLITAVTDKIYKRDVYDKTHEASISFSKKLEEEVAKVISTTKNFDFMIQTDNSGKRTGEFVTKYKAEYYQEKADSFIQREGEESKDFIERRNKWLRENHTGDYENRIPITKWEDPKFKVIQSTPILKEFYDYFIKTLDEANDRIPQTYRNSRQLPMYGSSLIEDIKNNGLQSAFKGLGARFKDAFLYTKDNSRAIIDESGQVVEFIPIRGKAGLDPNKISYDIPNILSAYNHMSLLYEHKKKVQDMIELTMDYLKHRDVPVLDGKGNVQVDQNGRPITKPGNESNVYQRFYDWYQMVFLEKKEKDTGEIMGVSKQKAAKAIGNYGSFRALALNAFSAFNNVAFGGASQMIEAAGGEFYGFKEYGKASKEYAKNIAVLGTEFIKNSFNKKKSGSDNKMALMIEYFDVLQDTNELRGQTKESKLSKIAFGAQKAGEHMMQSRVFIAMAYKQKIGEISIYDCYEVVDGKLQLKPEFKDSELANLEYRSNFRNLVKGVNQRIHGRYTDEDAAAIQQYALGYLGMQFRKWIHSGIEARFRKDYFDERLGRNVKGRWRSYVPFVKDLIRLKGNFLSTYKNLSAIDQANMRRNIVEMSYMVGVMILSGLLQAMRDDDESLKDNRAFNFLIYQASRFQSELAFYINPNDTIKIVRSPAASITTMESIIKLTTETIRFPFIDEEAAILQSGPNEGRYKVTKQARELVPILKEFDRWKNLDDEILYFKRF